MEGGGQMALETRINLIWLLLRGADRADDRQNLGDWQPGGSRLSIKPPCQGFHQKRGSLESRAACRLRIMHIGVVGPKRWGKTLTFSTTAESRRVVVDIAGLELRQKTGDLDW